MRRHRITITIRKDLLNGLDSYIDGNQIRNRSHAIDFILSKHLLPQGLKTLILAGGEKVKFPPLSQAFPQVLVPVQQKPLLAHTLVRLAQQNFRDITLAVNPSYADIKKYFKNGADFDVCLHYSPDTARNAGTVAPLLYAKRRLKDNVFLVQNGDVLADIDYLHLLDFHKKHKGVATIALTSVNEPHHWGIATMQGSQITRFEEKPKKQKGKSHLINAGIYLFEPEIFSYLKKNLRSLEHDLFPRLAQLGELYGYPFTGAWHEVNTPQAYARIQKICKQS